MTQKIWNIILGPLALTVVSVIGLTACSGSPDEEEQVAPDSANAGEEKAEAPAEEAAAGEAKAAAESAETATSAEATESANSAAAEAVPVPASDTVASSDKSDTPQAASADMAAASAPIARATPAAAPGDSAAPAPASTPAAAPAAASAAAAPAPSGGGGRVVRFIKVDQSELHAAASDASPVTMRLGQGEVVMVIEENGWGRISDALFVKLDFVSAKAVPRLFEKLVWQAPAH